MHHYYGEGPESEEVDKSGAKRGRVCERVDRRSQE